MTKGAWVGYGAALWALSFAVLHLVWATGWYLGLQGAQARLAFQKPWFLAYDLIVAGLCVVAVFVALALVAPCGRQFGDRRLLTLGWLGTGILVLRAGGSIVQTVYLVAVGRFVANPTMLFELWFYLGAALFALTLRRFYKLRRC